MGVLPPFNIHDMQTPEPVKHTPLLRADGKHLPRIGIDINMRAVIKPGLPRGTFAAQINRIPVGCKARHLWVCAPALNCRDGQSAGFINRNCGQQFPGFRVSARLCAIGKVYDPAWPVSLLNQFK